MRRIEIRQRTHAITLEVRGEAGLTIFDEETGQAIGLLYLEERDGVLVASVGGWNEAGEWTGPQSVPLVDESEGFTSHPV